MLDKMLILQARKASLENYLLIKGEVLKKEGAQSRVQGYSGLVVMNNKWYSHTMQKGGNTLDYLIHIDGIGFKKAVEVLCNYKASSNNFNKNKISEVTSPLIIPTRHTDDKRIIAYLMCARGIDKNVLLRLLKQGRIYEASNTHNCVFTGIDENMDIRYVMQRSSISKSSIKFESKGSDKRYSFSISGESDMLFVFESAIDLLSYMTIYPDTIVLKSHLLSLGGISDIALMDYLRRVQGIRKIILCLDNDKAGINANKQLNQKCKGENLKVYNHIPHQKDWNQELLAKAKI